jgi:hypothetical protein
MVVNLACTRMPYLNGITGSSFTCFYPFYLGEHSKPATRRLHVLGTTAALGLLAAALVTQSLHLLPLVPLAGYSTAWVGHYFCEHNRPATFKNPWYSLRGDLQLWYEVVTGQRPF